MDISPLIRSLSKRQLVELDSCVHCGECVKWCPVTTVEEDYENTPMDKIALLKSLVQRSQGPFSFLRKEIDPAELEKLADEVYRCSTCGRCGVVCPVGINCAELWPAVRGGLVELGYGPIEKIKESQEILEKVHNPFNFPMDERNKWMGDYQNKDKAEVLFFVGCELSYRVTPMAGGAVKIFTAGGADFTLSMDEWCCGYPLYALGNRSSEIQDEIEHNVKVFKKMGARKVAASCPCCYGMLKNRWKDYVGELPFEVVHVLNIADDLLEAGKLRFKKSYKGGPVTYHDPCYLSRGWGDGEGVIEEPRRLLSAIDGLDIVELADNKRLSLCPGSGGGLRRACPELSEKMAAAFVEEVKKTGAEILITSCPAVFERANHILSLKSDHEVEEDAPWGVDEDGKPKKQPFEVIDIMDFASRYL
jgi:heterodisulfide reductase subunit D